MHRRQLAQHIIAINHAVLGNDVRDFDLLLLLSRTTDLHTVRAALHHDSQAHLVAAKVIHYGLFKKIHSISQPRSADHGDKGMSISVNTQLVPRRKGKRIIYPLTGCPRDEITKKRDRQQKTPQPAQYKRKDRAAPDPSFIVLKTGPRLHPAASF